MVWGAIAAAVAPAIIGGVFSAFGASKQNTAAEAAADKQMAFQKETLQNQYQWGMADMKKAGLNPIIAYKQGGAGSAGGSSYSPVNVGAAATAGGTAGLNSGVAAQRIQLETNLNKATLGNIHEDTNKKFSEQRLNQSTRNLTEQNLRNAKIKAMAMRQMIEINKTDVTSAKAANKLYESPAGDFFKWWQMLKRK